jgi:uncharacterized protein (TIGR03086 family)
VVPHPGQPRDTRPRPCTPARTGPPPAHAAPAARCSGTPVEPGQLGLPTPCAEYDVRVLLSHIVGGLVRVAIAGEGGDALARPACADDVTDDGWPAAYQAASQRAIQAWADDAKLDALVEVPWGKIPGRFAIAGYVQEILTHGWDLAKATGQPTEPDPELAFFALAGAKRRRWSVAPRVPKTVSGGPPTPPNDR